MFDVQLPSLSYEQNYGQQNLCDTDTATTKQNQKMFFFWLKMYEQNLNSMETCALWQLSTHVKKNKK
jgi:hypothetical protein